MLANVDPPGAPRCDSSVITEFEAAVRVRLERSLHAETTYRRRDRLLTLQAAIETHGCSPHLLALIDDDALPTPLLTAALEGAAATEGVEGLLADIRSELKKVWVELANFGVRDFDARDFAKLHRSAASADRFIIQKAAALKRKCQQSAFSEKAQTMPFSEFYTVRGVSNILAAITAIPNIVTRISNTEIPETRKDMTQFVAAANAALAPLTTLWAVRLDHMGRVSAPNFAVFIAPAAAERGTMKSTLAELGYTSPAVLGGILDKLTHAANSAQVIKALETGVLKFHHRRLELEKAGESERAIVAGRCATALFRLGKLLLSNYTLTGAKNIFGEAVMIADWALA